MLVVKRLNRREVMRCVARKARGLDRSHPDWFWRDATSLNFKLAPSITAAGGRRGRMLSAREYRFLCRCWRLLIMNRRERRGPQQPGHACCYTEGDPRLAQQREWEALARARQVDTLGA
jgi:hypothetical protein